MCNIVLVEMYRYCFIRALFCMIRTCRNWPIPPILLLIFLLLFWICRKLNMFSVAKPKCRTNSHIGLTVIPRVDCFVCWKQHKWIISLSPSPRSEKLFNTVSCFSAEQSASYIIQKSFRLGFQKSVCLSVVTLRQKSWRVQLQRFHDRQNIWTLLWIKAVFLSFSNFENKIFNQKYFFIVSSYHF